MEDARDTCFKSQTGVRRSSSRISKRNSDMSSEEKIERSSKKFKSNENAVTQSCKQPESCVAPKKLEKIPVLPSNWCITQVSASSHSHGWSVQDFSLLNYKNGKSLRSPTFKIPQFPNLECHLVLYPNGHEEKCKDNTCIVFQCLAQDSLNVNCQLTLFNNCGTTLFSAEGHKLRTCSKELTTAYLHCQSCVKTKSKLVSLLKDDELLIACLLSINENVAFNKTSGDSGGQDSHDLSNQLELLSDLDKLYKENHFSDVALRIENQVFHAHKSILIARSSFFKKMFEHYKNEEHKEYDINNVSPSTFEKILHFIYTGKILDMNNSSGDLLEAAYKFNLSDLKTICERHLMNTLYINNACQILMLAEKVNASDLKKKAMNLIFAFKDQIINSSDFELVKSFSSNLYQEIICFVLCDGNI